jgi:hypothetical protein
MRSPPEPFRYVPASGRGCISQLIAQIPVATERRLRRNLENLVLKLPGKLPANELGKVVDPHKQP